MTLLHEAYDRVTRVTEEHDVGRTAQATVSTGEDLP
jgi:hypothetical protein